jgi:hypothetical protein
MTLVAASYDEAEAQARVACNLLAETSYGPVGWHLQHWNIRRLP